MKPKFKTNMALNIFNVLSTQNNSTSGPPTGSIFRNNATYEYDLDQHFGSSMPKVIMRMRDTSKLEEDKKVCTINEELLKRLGKVMNETKLGVNKVDSFFVKEQEKTLAAMKTTKQTNKSNTLDEEEDDIFLGVPKTKPIAETKPFSLTDKGLLDEEDGDIAAFFSALKPSSNAVLNIVGKAQQQEIIEDQKLKNNVFNDIDENLKGNSSDSDVNAEDHLKATLDQLRKKEKGTKPANLAGVGMVKMSSDSYMECFPKDTRKTLDLDEYAKKKKEQKEEHEKEQIDKDDEEEDNGEFPKKFQKKRAVQ